ncbi:hypothetical protein ACIRP0_31465 [Streptomyces sp. NPDC101733]|uniref:hypothetical protein n=1 Tax=unclassified Streptomyces TaxID=2593676 RepID=UPI003827F4E1
MAEPRALRARLVLAALVSAVACALIAAGFAAASLMGDDPKGQAKAGSPSPTTSATASPKSEPVTPETGKKITLRKPTGHKDGVATGFPSSPSGGISAVVYFWEEYAWLDDEKARQQLTAVASKDSPGYVDRRISEIRSLREAVNLPPSGGIPADITFTTAVNAVRGSTVKAPGLPYGDVIQVWVSYDRYATGPKGGVDENPLRGDMVDFMVKWDGSAWKFTDEYESLREFPVGYEATSRFAWSAGWVQVLHGD